VWMLCSVMSLVFTYLALLLISTPGNGASRVPLAPRGGAPGSRCEGALGLLSLLGLFRAL